MNSITKSLDIIVILAKKQILKNKDHAKIEKQKFVFNLCFFVKIATMLKLLVILFIVKTNLVFDKDSNSSIQSIAVYPILNNYNSMNSNNAVSDGYIKEELFIIIQSKLRV